MVRLNKEEKVFMFIAAFLLAILWLVIAYFGVKGAIVYCLIFSFIVTSFSRLLFSWGRSRPFTLAETWLPPVISLAATSFISLGIYHLVQFSQTGILNTVVFIPWLVILLGVPTAYYAPSYIKRYLTLRHQARNCIEAGVSIKHDSDLPIYIKELRFVNSVNGEELEIPVPNYRDKSDRDDDKEDASLAQKIDHAMRSMYFPKEYIPAGADKFYLSWYSIIEDKYYQDEFHFSFDGFSLRTMKYDQSGNQLLWNHLHRQNASVVSISIHYHGNVRFYRHSDMLICYANAKTKIISDKEKNSYLQRFKPYDQYTSAMVHDMTVQDRELAARRLAQRGEIQKCAINWCMRFEGLAENNKLDIDDAACFNYRCKPEELAVPDTKPLPEKVEVMYRSPDGLLAWLFIYLDVESLYRSIQLLTAGDKKMPVEFVVTVEDNHQNSIQFIINANNQSVSFNDWETTVNEEYKRKSKKLEKIAKQKKQHYQLLDSAWENVRNKDYQAAEKKCNTLLSKNSEFYQVYFLQAYLLLQMEGAAAYLAKLDYFVEKAGVDKPTLSRLYNSAGCALDDKQRYAEALPYFYKASQIEPDEGMYLANIAELHYKLVQAKEAMSYARQAQGKNYQSEMMNDVLKNKGVMK